MSRDASVHCADSDGCVRCGDVDLFGSEDAWGLSERSQRDADVDGDRCVREHGDGWSDDQCGGYDQADDIGAAGPNDDRMSRGACVHDADSDRRMRCGDVDVCGCDDAWGVRERL